MGGTVHGGRLTGHDDILSRWPSCWNFKETFSGSKKVGKGDTLGATPLDKYHLPKKNKEKVEADTVKSCPCSHLPRPVFFVESKVCYLGISGFKLHGNEFSNIVLQRSFARAFQTSQKPKYEPQQFRHIRP